ADQCLSCHTLGRGAPTEKCLACHPFDAIGVGRPGAAPAARAELAGMHRSFEGVACAACHTDHAGVDPSAATNRFSHDALKGDLRRRCLACHASKRPADAIHRGAGDDCAACHATSAWKPATFAHENYFGLDRDHNVACATCHDRPGEYRAYTCYGCHEHSVSRMESKHREEGIADLANCVRCHKSAQDKEGHGGGGEGRGGEGERHRDDEGKSGHEEHDDD
ncbi:MAG TPA: class III cytochrome C family protein, partial [Candidatus Eisenbacteria bacterium]|nr:class III cytochrome C family protein [Candidatus Eisenbacteria bacterium]